MKKTFTGAFIAALILIATLGVPFSQAYVLLGPSWNYLPGNPKTVNIYVNPNCADPTAPNELTSLQSAMNSWGNAGANFRFNYAGATSVTNAYYNNFQNDVCWNSGSSGGALATTYMWGGVPNMTQADMVFWDGPWTWSTSWPTFSQFDVESVGLHEFGHIVGLGHSQYNWAVMWYSIAYGEVQRALSSDDIAGILAIYGGGSVNLTVDLTPTGSTTVPSGGGSIPYTLYVHNNGSSSATFAIWMEYLNSQGQSYGYVIQRPSITLGGGGTINRPLVLTIPGSLPAGNYTFYCRTAATLGGTPYYAQDSFPFTKTSLDNGGPWYSETSSTGWDDPLALEAAVPERFLVIGAYPNPFNPETSIQFDLPQATRLNLAIYDMQGRKLMDLLDGNMEAGRYSAVWNAGNYPSGTYLYRLTSDLGSASGKMLLMK
jgi:hypothetical protein